MMGIKVDYFLDGVHQSTKLVEDLPDEELVRLINDPYTTSGDKDVLRLLMYQQIMQGMIRQRHGTVRTRA